MIKATTLLCLITLGIGYGFAPVPSIKRCSLTTICASAAGHVVPKQPETAIAPKKEKKKKIYGYMMRNLESETRIQSSLSGDPTGTTNKEDLGEKAFTASLDNYYRLP